MKYDSYGPFGRRKSHLLCQSLWPELLNLGTVAALYQHDDLQRGADCFLPCAPQRPVRAFPQHLPVPEEAQTSPEISWSSLKAQLQPRANRSSDGITAGVPGQGQSSRVPPSVQEQGPPDLSWRFLALPFPVQAHSLSPPRWTQAHCWI